MSGGADHNADHNKAGDQTGSLLDQWTSSLADVVQSMADQKPEVRWGAAGAPPAEPELLWWEQPFHGMPGALVWVPAGDGRVVFATADRSVITVDVGSGVWAVAGPVSSR